jgi:dipeptidase E
MNKRLLLLSNSTNAGEEYLAWPANRISAFLGDQVRRVTFVPFAAVTLTWDEYHRRVAERMTGLGYACESVHQAADPAGMLKSAEAIVVGGGNTFHLLHQLQQQGCLSVIREKVMGGCPYIGWSAGSNIACPTIMTTNDMPVVQPRDFKGLGLVPFQINPHYTDAVLPNHGGETREMRLQEFLEINPGITVLGLPEGSLLRLEGEGLTYDGTAPLKIFRKGLPVKEASGTPDLSWLLKI